MCGMLGDGAVVLTVSCWTQIVDGETKSGQASYIVPRTVVSTEVLSSLCVPIADR